MELYLGQVPSDHVWVVHVDHGWGSDAYFWFLTSEASTATYRDEERFFHDRGRFDDPDNPVTLTRWEITLPKRASHPDRGT